MDYTKRKTLDLSLNCLLEKAKNQTSVSFEEILTLLSGNGRFVFLVFLSLPFCQPIQIPGMSIPFGLLISFMGLKLALGKQVFFPKKFLGKEISSAKIKKIIQRIFKVTQKIKKFTHPRLRYFCEFKGQSLVNGTLICLLGVFLALPFPIPFTNLVAGWSIFLLSLGKLEDDGLLILIGYLMSLLTFLLFVCLFISAKLMF